MPAEKVQTIGGVPTAVKVCEYITLTVPPAGGLLLMKGAAPVTVSVSLLVLMFELPALRAPGMMVTV